MDLKDTYKKLHAAVRYLASSDGDLRERLASAYLGYFTFTPHEFPAELQEQYRVIVASLTNVHAPDDWENAATTTKALSILQAREVAGSIFDLFIQIRQRTTVEDQVITHQEITPRWC